MSHAFSEIGRILWQFSEMPCRREFYISDGQIAQQFRASEIHPDIRSLIEGLGRFTGANRKRGMFYGANAQAAKAIERFVA